MLSVVRTDIKEFPLLKQGKVRDIYDLGDKLLIVTTDRISAFDHILPTPIPERGKILNLLSVFWFDFFKDLIKNHLISWKIEDFPEELQKYKDLLEGRSVIVKKAEVIPVECIVRGYLAGSGYKEYREKGEICGIKLPSGLKEGDKLPEPIFTPSTKAELGEHDINITFEEMEKLVGKELAKSLKEISLAIYKKASTYAEERGIIIADTKFEFGICGGELVLIDEVLTPDSSRFWPKEEYSPGKAQKSFDKQFIRDWLKNSGWKEGKDLPEIPEEVVQKTREKYLEAFFRLTGKNPEEFMKSFP